MPKKQHYTKFTRPAALRQGRVRGWIGLALLLLLAGAPALAEDQPDLAQLSLEDLMNLQVTSVAKRQQSLLETAAAVYVITQEDIRRSGVTSLPEALRLAPGVEVAQINGYTWAISIRGFNYRYANQLLVLIDGRAVYSPVFSGVFWDLQDTMLEDVERIEVIRGPGATLWGANAVNGVINIITKHAGHSQGGLITANGGSRSYSSEAARFGARVGEKFAYRFFGKYSREDRSPGLNLPGPDAFDAWDMARGGFRADWEKSSIDSLTFSGDLYYGNEEQTFLSSSLLPPFSVPLNSNLDTQGGDLLSRWQHQFAGGSKSTLQVYYDHMNRPMPVARLWQGTFDIDFQHQLQFGSRHKVIWGSGYRFTREEVRGSFTMWWNPAGASWSEPQVENNRLLNAFAQDEITLISNRLWFTAGSKFELDQFQDFNVQPSVRLRWEPHARHTLWAAASRALRTPSEYEEVARITNQVFPGPQGIPSAVTVFGNDNLKPGSLLAYELGYRAQLSRQVSLDWAAFYNTYHGITGEVSQQPFIESNPLPVHLVIPMQFANNVGVHSYGMEISSSYTPASYWKLVGSYSWLYMDEHPAVLTQFKPGNNPEHQCQAHSNLTFRRNFELDNGIFYVGALGGQPAPSYLRLDSRVGWHPGERLEFSVVGQNLLRPRHPEFLMPDDRQGYAQVGRSVYGKVTWRF